MEHLSKPQQAHSALRPKSQPEYDSMGFNPMRLDWTSESPRSQIFYKGGHYMGEIPIWADGSIDTTCNTFKNAKRLMEEVYVPTCKIVTWGDLKKSKKIDLNRFSLDYQASGYLKYIPDFHSTGGSMQREETVTGRKLGGKGEDRDEVGSTFYHGCKGHWLLHDVKKNGLNQPIQGVIFKSHIDDEYNIHIHPGSVRQGVFGMMDDDDNELIIWDAYNAFDEIDPLPIEDWMKIFARPQFDSQIPTCMNLVYSYTHLEIQVSGAWKDEKEDMDVNWRAKVKEFSKKVSKKFNGKPLNIYIGYDSRHEGIEDIQIESIQKAMTKTIKNEPAIKFVPEFKLLDISKIPEYTREYGNQSTEFTYSRFLIPYLENYEGFSMFIDNDFIWKRPLWEMFYFLHPDNAVACVQYEHELEKMSTTKMGGEKNVLYPKKLWSSFMVFNNSHEDCKKLTPDIINTESGEYLHQFKWTDKIDRIPDKYILTEGMSDDDKRHHAVHYTRGGPWIEGMDCSEIKHLELYNTFLDNNK